MGSRADSSDKGGEQKGQSRSLTFEATGECRYLVRRGDEAGQLMISMTNCEVRTRL